MKILGIIPARLESTRFPNKMLAEINNVPLISKVYLNNKDSGQMDDLFIATHNDEISDVMKQYTDDIVMTDKYHRNCISRCREALDIIEHRTGNIYDIVCIIQGDEPMVTHRLTDKAIKYLLDNSSFENWTDIVNIGSLLSETDKEDINVVKVFTEPNNDIAKLYSRKIVVPHLTPYKQTCIIPMRREALMRFNVLSETLFETLYKIDMLRYLQNDFVIRIFPVFTILYNIDVPMDIEKIEKIKPWDVKIDE